MYTKGDWEVRQLPITKEVYVACGTELIAGGLTSDNARLIAQAPRLYEELVRADAVICRLCVRLNPQHENCTSCQNSEGRTKAIAEVEKK